MLQKDKKINDLTSQVNNLTTSLSTRESDITTVKSELKNTQDLSRKVESTLNENMGKFKNSEKLQKDYKFKFTNVEQENTNLNKEIAIFKQSIETEQVNTLNAKNALKQSNAINNQLKEKLNLLSNENNKLNSDIDSTKELKENYSIKLNRVASDLSTQESLNEDLKQQTRKSHTDTNIVSKENKVLGLRVHELESRN